MAAEDAVCGCACPAGLAARHPWLLQTSAHERSAVAARESCSPFRPAGRQTTTWADPPEKAEAKDAAAAAASEEAETAEAGAGAAGAGAAVAATS